MILSNGARCIALSFKRPLELFCVEDVRYDTYLTLKHVVIEICGGFNTLYCTHVPDVCKEVYNFMVRAGNCKSPGGEVHITMTCDNGRHTFGKREYLTESIKCNLIGYSHPLSKATHFTVSSASSSWPFSSYSKFRLEP